MSYGERVRLFSAALLSFLLLAKTAEAIERQHHLGLAPELGILKVRGKSTTSTGFGGALHYTYGLTDQWNLAVEASSVVVALDQQQDFENSPKNRPTVVNHAAVGAGYVIDILRWVPYVNLQGGMFLLTGGTLPDALFLPGLSIGAGVDYQFSRSFAVGIGARQHLMISKLKEYPSYTTVLLRLEYMWGY